MNLEAAEAALRDLPYDPTPVIDLLAMGIGHEAAIKVVTVLHWSGYAIVPTPEPTP